MKVVVVKMPKFFSGIVKRILKIDTNDEIDS